MNIKFHITEKLIKPAFQAQFFNRKKKQETVYSKISLLEITAGCFVILIEFNLEE